MMQQTFHTKGSLAVRGLAQFYMLVRTLQPTGQREVMFGVMGATAEEAWSNLIGCNRAGSSEHYGKAMQHARRDGWRAKRMVIGELI